jgi:hypothetical protein
MKTATFASMTLAALFSAAVIGCDEKVAEKKTMETKPDGTTVTKKETVKQDSDSTTVEKKTDVDRPGVDKAGDHTKEKTTVETK